MKARAGTLIAQLRSTPSTGLLHVELYRAVRQMIIDGSLVSGARLPSTRTVASDLGVSRTTAEEAYAQLAAEGYIERRVGSGSYVSEAGFDAPPAMSGQAKRRAGGRRSTARRSEAVAAARACEEPAVIRPFAAGIPAVDHFPFPVWRRLVNRCAGALAAGDLTYGDPAGYLPLRRAIASYLRSSRGVICDERQIVILNSSQQALDLIARVMLDPGESVWFEDPGYRGARSAFTAAGAKLVPVPVDGDGLDVQHAIRQKPDARMAYVTPSHQYPLGVTLSLERRLELLRWAEERDAWVVEDDYDSEFRYEGRPIAAIQGLDTNGRVLYVGTFTKVLFPSLRLAYLVAPEDLVDAFVNARTHMDGHSPLFLQSVVSEFIEEGHFHALIRRLRAVHRERRDVLVEALSRRTAGALEPGSSDGGLHVTAFLGAGRRDVAFRDAARGHGLELPVLSESYLISPRHGFILGFAALREEEISWAADQLARLL
jgi:GntR family transcriptional regulator / MocR family aminotransferase